MIRYTNPDPARLETVLQICPQSGIIVDVGGGINKFQRATHVVDLLGEGAINIDVEHEDLPFNSIDFLYCRHLLEDLNNPRHLLEEIRKKAKKGYIEVPSLLSEVCYGLEQEYPWRGYWHHRWFVYVNEGVLTFVPKLVAISGIGPGKNAKTRIFLEHKDRWNTGYYFGSDSFKYEIVSPIKMKWNMTDYIEEIRRIVDKEIGV